MDPLTNSAAYFGASLPAHPTAKQEQLIKMVKFLGGGLERMRDIQVKSVLLNFEMMAFAITWFGLVCPANFLL